MANLIGICGYAGSGKDTVAKIIQYLTYCQRYYRTDEPFKQWGAEYSVAGWEVHSFGDKLKEVAAILLGVSVSKFYDREFKESVLPAQWDKVVNIPLITFGGNTITRTETYPMTVREFLQQLATDAVRYGLHIDTWVNALFNDYKPITCVNQTIYCSEDQDEKCHKGYDYGCYPNWIIPDVRFHNEYQAIKDRKGIMIGVHRDVAVMRHVSENTWRNFQRDYDIENNGTIEDLIPKVKQILQKEGIIT